MTRHRSFTTAAARRKADPIIWDIDGTEIRLRSFVDIIEIAEAVERMQAPMDDQSITGIVARKAAMVEIITTFVDEGCRDAWQSVAPIVDLGILVEMTRDAIAEFAGLGNSGPLSSSSGGSSATGASSTDGVLPEGSTLPL